MKWKALVGISIGAFFLYLAVRKIDLKEVQAAFNNVHYGYVMLIVILSIVSLWIRAVRWRFMLSSTKRIRLYPVFKIVMIGFMANNLLPARLGEIVRAYFLGKREDVSISFSFATIVLERIIDALTLLFLFSVLYLGFTHIEFPFSMHKIGTIIVVLFFVLIVFLLAIRYKTDFIISGIEFVMIFGFKRYVEQAKNIVQSFLEGMNVIHSFRDLVKILWYSLLVWLSIILIFELSLRAMYITEVPFYTSILVSLFIVVGLLIPAAPGFVGTIQYCCVLGLGWFGISEAQAFSFSILYHMGQFIPITLLGLYYFSFEGAHFSDIVNMRGKV